MSKKKKFELTDQQKKYVVYALLGVSAFLVIRKLKDWLKKPAKETIKDVIEEADRLKKQGVESTRSLGQWKLVADSIYNSMKSSATSDNKSNIEKQLKMVQNDLDFLLLTQAYGLRQHYIFAIPDGDKTTLIGQIATGELSDKRIKSINSNYATKGIKFRF